MRYLLALLLLLVPIGEVQSQSQERELHVWSEVILKPTVEDHYTRVVVHPAGVLKLLPGSVLQLLPGGELSVHGVLEARGTPQQHVHIRASDVDIPFGSVQIKGRADFEQVVIEGSSGVVGERVSFSQVVLRDGTPLLRLTGSGGGYQMGSLRFENLRQGTRMERMGVVVDGPWSSLDLRGVEFPALRSIPVASRGELLQVFGSVDRGVRWPNQPVPACETAVTGNKLAIVRCTTETLPVLFVPGYGTSVNLAHLVKAQADPAPTRSGWGFISSLVGPYLEVLSALEAAGVPVAVAHYDWRIPSERAMREYLIPALVDLKRKTGAPAVHVVAHSFGGILTQQYVVSDAYAGDLASATLIGTPSKGSPKAYGPWEGGELPPDWSIVGHLIRTYGVQTEGRSQDFLGRIRRFIPSLRELMPEPKMVWGPTGAMESLVHESPAQALFAQRSARLLARTALTTVSGTGQLTYPRVLVGAAQAHRWEDGVLESYQPLERVGDGTVPASSVGVSGARNVSYSASHLALVSAALPTISEQLGVPLTPVPLPERRMKWFVVDCPVDVSIILPTGEQIVAGSSPDTFVSDEATWLIVPDTPGEYEVRIHAREDTEVRFWVDHNEALRSFQYAGTTQVISWPPSPNNAPSVLEDQWPVLSLSVSLPQISLHSLLPWPSFSLRSLALTWLTVGN